MDSPGRGACTSKKKLQIGILKMDSPGRGACKGNPKLLFGTRGHQGPQKHIKFGFRGWENLRSPGGATQDRGDLNLAKPL